MTTRLSRTAALCAAAALVSTLGFAAPRPAAAQFEVVSPSEAPVAMTVRVDASEATNGIVHVRESIPLAPGRHVLVYPKWVPGEHAPSGPIANLATIAISADGRTIPWVRDQVDLYAFRVDVPDGVSKVDVSFDYLGGVAGNYSAARLASPNLLSVTWHKFVMYPDVENIKDVAVTPSIVLPGANWKYATALTTTSHEGATVAFAPTTMEQLVDSPLDAGVNSRSFPLGSLDGAPVDLAVFSDTPEELEIPDSNIARFRNLVREMGALYGARHFDHYTFLLTTSDVMPGEGVEHHQSSDDGTDGDFISTPGHLLDDADLLSHEFNHSWDGKYRRPADLAQPNLQVAEHDDLLWVYEGMTQFYGKLQAARSGLLTKDEYLESLAETYAALDQTTGRLTRSLGDTATSGPFLYGAPREFAKARRQVDFYEEGLLMWLEADVLIRRHTGGKKSIDDFARVFFGGKSTGPVVVPYDREAVVAAMNTVLPYDWTTFFTKRIDEIAPHPPDPFTPAGYRLVYTGKMSAYGEALAKNRHVVNAFASVGLAFGTKNAVIGDVIQGSPAAKAGLAPGVKIIGIDGRTLDAGDAQGQFDDALTAAKTGPPMQLLVTVGDTYRTVTVDYRGGPRYPHLRRIAGTPDGLSAIVAPLPAAGYERIAPVKATANGGSDEGED